MTTKRNPALRRHINTASTAIINAKEAARRASSPALCSQVTEYLNQAMVWIEETYKVLNEVDNRDLLPGDKVYGPDY